MLFGGHDSDFLAKVSEGLKKLPFSRKSWITDCAGTFYIAKHLINYFTNSKSTLNYTQNFILTALKNDYVISICRALGIISK
jgi:hypothetical protein